MLHIITIRFPAIVTGKDYQNMVKYFQNLENDKLFAYENYVSMSPYTGTYDFNSLKTRSIFQYQVQKLIWLSLKILNTAML